MQVQQLSLPGYTLSPPNVSQSKQLSTKLLRLNSHSKPGFCNSSKAAFKSLTGVRNHCGLVGIRCEVAQQDVKDDWFYMRRGVELARKAIGCTCPNLMLGCVIVKDGKVVGKAFTLKLANHMLRFLL